MYVFNQRLPGWGTCNPSYPHTALAVVCVQIAEKIRYAKWKAVDIMRAISSGQVPRSGPYGEVSGPVLLSCFVSPVH